MADKVEQRDFFISFNSADLAYAEAIDAALQAAGFTTHFHHLDLRPGGHIPKWMEDALKKSDQLLALFSPNYLSDRAVYAEAELYASFWRDTRGDKFKIVPVVLAEIEFPLLMAVYKRIDATNKTPSQAAAAVVTALKTPKEIKEREFLRGVRGQQKIFKALYRHNPNFSGRDEAMDSLHGSLQSGNAAITAVAGLGGIGKTTLAAEYCHRFRRQYGGVWWVRAEQEPVLLEDIAALGLRLGLPPSGNIEADVQATLDYLVEQPEPWLMVYDNAPNPDALRRWLPSGEIRCIITSRSANFDDLALVTRLDQWSDAVTADYLLTRTGRDDKDGALRLARLLDGLPLAAEQAAVFLRDRKGISFDDYAKEIARLIKEERPSGSRGEYPDTVYAAFVKSLGALIGMKGGRAAIELVQLCSFLSPDGVDLALLLSDPSGRTLPADFGKVLADPFAREDTLAALASLSLLRQEDGPAGTILIFHRLLLDSVRDWMSSEAQAVWGDAAVRLVGAHFPYDADDDPRQWPLCALLMTHVATLQAHAPRTGEAGKALSRILNQACLYLAARGDRDGALAAAESSVSLSRQVHEGHHENISASLNNLGLQYFNLDRNDEAVVAFREAMALREERDKGEDYLEISIILSNLAAAYFKRRQYAEAEDLFLRTLDVMAKEFGPDSAQYGGTLGNLDALYDEWANESGDPDKRRKAEEYSARALAITQAARGPRHPQTSTAHHNLAVLKGRLRDWKGAVSEAEKAVAIMLSLDLSQHSDTLTAVLHLVDAWRESGASKKASRLAEGDISDILPIIAEVEAEHRAWVVQDPENRHFGPPSPFE